MKNENTHARKLAALLRRLKESVEIAQPAPRDPVSQMVVSFLQWNAPRRQAAKALARLTTVLVDHNDLRVSHPHEIVAILGREYPLAEERAARLHESLQEVFIREHAVSLDALASMGKKQVRAYLDSLPGMTPYVGAQLLLMCFGGHAVPVDDLILEQLAQHEAIEPGYPVDQAEAFIERHVKAGEAMNVHLLLEAAVADGAPRRPSKKPAAKSSSKKKAAHPKAKRSRSNAS